MIRPRHNTAERVAWYLLVLAAAGGGIWLATVFKWQLVWQASPLLLQGLSVTCGLTAISVVGGMLLGTILAIARIGQFRGLRYVSIAITETVRATPQLMVIFWVFFAYPAITGHSITAWIGGAVALTLIAGSYLAEVIRGGFLTIPNVQRESASLLGLSRGQTTFFILLPQACRNMLPAFIATIIMMFKTTSLIYVIGVVDFFKAVVIVNSRAFEPLTMYTLLAIVYFICCYALSRLVRFIDPKYEVVA